MQEFRAAFDKEDAAFKQYRASDHTAALQQADEECDRLYASLRDTIKAYAKFPIAETAQHAEPLLKVIKNYKISTRESYRITYRNNRLSAKTIPISSLYMLDYIDAEDAIPIYTRCYLDALKRLVPNYKLPQRSINQCSMEYSFNWCYVYLMKDTSNGYYKIGISNTPEYREHTLQSEKPTIEMLACKKFPTRKIAESIESALHTTYSQQRLRGEWFNLTDADVAAIIETLK